MDLYAEIIVNSDAVEIDRPFTYKIPTELDMVLQVGHRVKVPFGKSSKLTEGFVIGMLCDIPNSKIKYKKIHSVLDEDPILSRDDLKLIDFMRRKYLCKYIDGIRTILPVGLMKGIKNKKKLVICYENELTGSFIKKENYNNLFKFIRENSGIYSKAELNKEFKFSTYAINKLIEENILSQKEIIVYRYNKKRFVDYKSKILTKEQQDSLNRINSSYKRGILLKGVTGSGKTEVYLELVKEVLKKGEGAIVLVPEIALTPQMIERFKGRFGEDVALFHSKLSDGERYDEWFRVREGKAKLVVGARSAIFLPVQDLSLIIIDEEHENTYKSEHNPKYVTREIAQFLSEMKECKYILGSATPSFESYYRAISGELELVELKNRVDNRPLPQIEIVDMREELKSKNLSLFSRILYDEIKERLEKKEQVILFLNRRGFSSFVSCRSCGYVFKCPECDVSMTYHTNGYLVCHYCGRAMKEKKICPKCESKYVKHFGAGTQRVEDEVRKHFPGARVLRMDVDTTREKNSHEEIYNAFKNGMGDILIGTQMVSKGLDFPNVTLVGVLAADISLNISDYRAKERTYQILTQVSGRAGRGTLKGKVIIQTYSPENNCIEKSKMGDYEGLYKEEIGTRKALKYPPFGRLFYLVASGKNEVEVKEFMKKLLNELEICCKDIENITFLGPASCVIGKFKDNFRWQITVKGDLNDEILHNIKEKVYELTKKVYNNIKISMDINPNSMT
ncbi:MAG: primosomal protein N' [Clostridium sp.]